jgi:integrase
MSVYKRKSGRWAVLIDADRGADGERKRRALGTFATRKDAERAERQALEARDRGIDLVPGKVTVAALFDRYLAHVASQGAAAITLWRYRDLADRNILPDIGALPLAKLKPAHVSAMCARLLTSGRAKGRGKVAGTGLSPRTVGHAFTLLKGALAWAVRMELVGRNVAAAVTPPSVTRREAAALAVEEAQRLLDATEGTRWGPLFALALATGARRGELAALRWCCIDPDRLTMTVRSSLSHVNGEIGEKTTKTGRVRTVALSSLAVNALRTQHARQSQDKLRAKEGAYSDDDLVFANELGGRLSPGAITRAFYEFAVTLKLPTTSFHGLRHTAASWLLASGVDVRTVGGVLGHSTAATTLSVYAHMVEGAQAAAVAKIDEALERLRKA